MTDLFSPRRPDGRAEWRVIHDTAVDLPYGSDLTFDEIAKLLDIDDRSRAHRAVRRCNQQFTRENVSRILGNVRGSGYRVLRPSDYAPAALAYQVQARRKISSAVDIMRAAPLNDMTPAQRDWAHKVLMVLVDNDLRLRSQEQWQSEAEKRLAELERRAGIQPDITLETVKD
jgi:hypothetical protein